MKTISFKTTKEEYLLISKIVKRTFAMRPDLGAILDYQSLIMDITACHANGNPLRLAGLLKADDFNFAHDVFGIHRHIDRNTGELTDCFSPRFSQPASL